MGYTKGHSLLATTFGENTCECRCRFFTRIYRRTFYFSASISRACACKIHSGRTDCGMKYFFRRIFRRYQLICLHALSGIFGCRYHDGIVLGSWNITEHVSSLSCHQAILICMLCIQYFFCFWMPEILEFWILQMILDMAVTGRNVTGVQVSIQGHRPYRLCLCCVYLLFLINYFGSLRWLQKKTAIGIMWK